jgi:Protein of unknown function (DUF3306)
MSGVSSFIGRWSRRKRAATEDAENVSPSSDSAGSMIPPLKGEVGKRSDLPLAGGGTQPAFDLTKLPPIESIAAESDIRAFLAPGVPLELTRAALRRAWAADPKIRDFIGLSENAWDFNAPGAIPGFGPLEMTDELRDRIAQMMGRNVSDATADVGTWPAAPQEARAAIDRTSESSAGTGDVTPREAPDICPASRGEPEASNVAASSGNFSQCGNIHVAAQREPEEPRRSTARGSHGGALPK